MKRTRIQERNAKIFFEMSMGHSDTEIGRDHNLTPGRVHQIRDIWKAKHDQEFPFYYVEFLDHSMTKGINQLVPSELAIVGQLVKETKDALYFRQSWSRTLAEDINQVIVIKSTIKRMDRLMKAPFKDKMQKGGGDSTK